MSFHVRAKWYTDGSGIVRLIPVVFSHILQDVDKGLALPLPTSFGSVVTRRPTRDHHTWLTVEILLRVVQGLERFDPLLHEIEHSLRLIGGLLVDGKSFGFGD